jgi:hypothetical protein
MAESKLNLPEFEEGNTEKPNFCVLVYKDPNCRPVFFNCLNLVEAEKTAERQSIVSPGADVHIMKSYVVFRTETVRTVKRYPVI